MSEEWRPVDGWPYEVSSEGRIRRSVAPRPHGTARTFIGKVVTGSTDDGGYRNIQLCDGPKKQTTRVQYLVAAAFLPPRPSPRHMLDHINRVRGDNSAANLRWVTARQNSENNGPNLARVPKPYNPQRPGPASERSHKTKLNAAQVAEIRRRYSEGVETQATLATEFGVVKNTVGFIVRGETWRQVPL